MKKIAVKDWTAQVSAASDIIPVEIKRGSEVVEKSKSLFTLASHGSVGTLEAIVTFVSIKADKIIIQIK